MTVDELTSLIPQLLEARYPGQFRRVGPDILPGMQDAGGWVVQQDGVYTFLRAAHGGDGFLWVRHGVAHAIPTSNELAFHVAAANKDLMLGRAYLAYGDEVAMVVVDETVLAPALAWDYEPSIRDLIQRVETSMGHAKQMREEIFARFGGQPFEGEDWMLVMF